MTNINGDLLEFVGSRRFSTVLADPPWQFANRTGKIAPEHRRLSRYGTLRLEEIMALRISEIATPTAHLGKAISSILQGDPHRARHFAYYAELRAALSLLAAEGIGVFDKQHFAINGINSVTKLESPKGAFGPTIKSPH